MKKDINFTKSEAAALRNITGILIGYINSRIDEINTQEQLVSATILVHLHEALSDGETKFGYSNKVTEFLIDSINFWYNGVAIAVLKSDALRGPAGDMFRKHYNLVPGIIKKLNK